MSVPALDIRVPLGRPLPEVAAFARRCEDAGLSGVGVPDHDHVGRDAYADADVDDDDALADRVLDAYGLFGPSEQCAERLQRACSELDPTRLFLFSAHSWDTTYDLPEAAAAASLVPALEELA